MKCPVCRTRKAKYPYFDETDGDILVCGHCLRKLKSLDKRDLKFTEDAYATGFGFGTEDDRFIADVEHELFNEPRSENLVPAIGHRKGKL